MRIQLINGGALSGWLTREGYVLTAKDPDYIIEIVQTDHNWIAIATGNIELENLLIEKLRELGEKTFMLDKSPPLSDRKLIIKVPVDCKSDIERGVFRAFVMYLLKNSVTIAPIEPKPEVPPVPWYKRLFPLQLAIAFLSFAVDTNAQDGMTFIQLWTSSGPVYAADFANNAMRVNVVAGAGSGGTASSFGAAFPATGTAAGFISSTGNMAGANLDASGNLEVSCLVGCSGSSFADSTPLTFGVTSVSVFAAVVDDTGTNTVAENSAGAPRMNTNRILYTMSTNSTGTQVGTAGAPIRTDPTGTTIQPVSGTVTATGPLTDAQLRASAVPISVASLPLPTGAATSALQTQPGVDIGDVTINNAAGAAAVNIQDGGNIITVDGTVAVSGTVAVTGPLTDAQLRATPVPVSSASLPLPTGASTLAEQLVQTIAIATPRNNRTGTGSPLNALNAAVTVSAQGTSVISWEIDSGLAATNVVSFEARLTSTGTYFSIEAMRLDGTLISTTSTFPDRGFFFATGAYDSIRIRVSTFTSGSSAARSEACAGCIIPLPSSRIVRGAISAVCTTPCDSPETANSSVIIPITQNLSGIWIDFISSTYTGTVACDMTSDDIHWNLATCTNMAAAGLGARGAFILNPVAQQPWTPNLSPGTIKFRIRGQSLSAGSAVVQLRTTFVNDYNINLPSSAWQGGQVPQRGNLQANSDGSTSCTASDGTGAACLIYDFTSNTLPLPSSYGKHTKIISGSQTAAVTAAWSSATGVDTALTLPLLGAGMVACTVNITGGTITAGTFNIEVSDNLGTNYYQTAASITYSAGVGQSIATSYLPVLSGGVIERAVVGYTNFRLRLNPVITGAGTANIRCQAGTFPSSSMTAVSSVVPGSTASTLGKAEDAVAVTGDVGVKSLFLRDDVLASGPTSSTSASGDYQDPKTDAHGAVWIHDRGVTTDTIRVTSSANSSITATLAAAGAGLFHYITFIRQVRSCTTAITGTATLSTTTTNLSGTAPGWIAGNACAVGSTNIDFQQAFSSPWKSTTANTATTIVCPAIGAAGICSLTVSYFTGL